MRVRGTLNEQVSTRVSSKYALTQANTHLIECDQIPPAGVEGHIAWNPMPENTHFYHISLGEGFVIQLQLMQISVVRKTVFMLQDTS